MLQYTLETIKEHGGLQETMSELGLKLKKEILEAPQTESYEIAELAKTAYELNSDKPWMIQRAESIKNILEHMTIYLRDGELLVGNRSEKLGAMPRIPEGIHPISGEYCEQAPYPAGRFEERWEDRYLFKSYWETLSEETKDVERELLAGAVTGSHEGFGHILADYEIILHEGISGLLEKVHARLADLPDYEIHKRAFLQSVIIAWTGVANWAQRYADLAELKAKDASAERREELFEIARICRKVPMYPAETFAEAVQSFWFVHQALLVEQKAGSISVSGLDRYLNPYLLHDIDTGVLTWARAEILVENLFIKFMENAIWPVYIQQFAHLSLGGIDIDGEDTVNELSFLFLNAHMKIRANTPLVSVRWHPGINRDFWLMAHRSIRLGTGLPALFSDDKMIQSLRTWGVPEERAVNYGVVGCVEPSVRGEMMGSTLGGHLNVAKCLELALNNGRALITQRQLGPDTGSLMNYDNLNVLIEAYKAQVESAVLHGVETVNAAARSQRMHYGYPIMSGVMHGCIDSCRDMTEGGVPYNYTTICVLGITDVVDSMLAIDHFVWETKEFTAEELLLAIRTNFKDREPLRLRLNNYPEKFGNGCKRAVELFNRLSDIHMSASEKYSGPRGDYFSCGTWPTTLHVTYGAKTGALPSGRHAGAPLVDGVGACHGMDKNGPTSLFRDVSEIEAVRDWPGGYTFNVRFTQSMMQGEEALTKFADLTETFFKLGGMQMQINTVSAETLKEAQKHPEEYGELLVRVAGFSTYFVGLSKSVQDEIIERTTHG